MVVIFLSILISGIVALARQELVRKVVEKTLEAEASGNETDTGLLKFAHDQFGCCGIYNLDTCDQDYPPVSVCVANSTLCQHGCLEQLWQHIFEPYLEVASGVLFGISAIVFIGIVLGSCLFRALSKGHYSYVRQE